MEMPTEDDGKGLVQSTLVEVHLYVGDLVRSGDYKVSWISSR